MAAWTSTTAAGERFQVSWSVRRTFIEVTDDVSDSWRRGSGKRAHSDDGIRYVYQAEGSPNPMPQAASVNVASAECQLQGNEAPPTLKSEESSSPSGIIAKNANKDPQLDQDDHCRPAPTPGQKDSRDQRHAELDPKQEQLTPVAAGASVDPPASIPPPGRPTRYSKGFVPCKSCFGSCKDGHCGWFWPTTHLLQAVEAQLYGTGGATASEKEDSVVKPEPAYRVPTSTSSQSLLPAALGNKVQEVVKGQDTQGPSSFAMSPVGDIDIDSLPSMGSAGHKERGCAPCKFWMRGECTKGHACGFCHMHIQKIKPKQRISTRVQAQILETAKPPKSSRGAVYPSHGMMPGSWMS